MMVDHDVEKINSEHHYHLLTEAKFSLQQITEEDDDDENEKIWKGWKFFMEKNFYFCSVLEGKNEPCYSNTE